jgi:hypothetical protein
VKLLSVDDNLDRARLEALCGDLRRAWAVPLLPPVHGPNTKKG